jgi:hypothetical protein
VRKFQDGASTIFAFKIWSQGLHSCPSRVQTTPNFIISVVFRFFRRPRLDPTPEARLCSEGRGHLGAPINAASTNSNNPVRHEKCVGIQQVVAPRRCGRSTLRRLSPSLPSCFPHSSPRVDITAKPATLFPFVVVYPDNVSFFVGEVRGSGAVNNLPAHVKSPGLISGGLIGLVAGINLLSKIKKKTAITYSSRARKIIQHGRRNGLMEEFGTYGDVIWRTLP